MRYLAARLDAFDDARHFYPLRELTLSDGAYILVYPYEESEPVIQVGNDEWCSFLAEAWERRVIIRSVSLGNFRRARGVLKLVDYEIEPYDDNLFLNMAARAYVQLPHVRARVPEYERFRRAAINAFELPELGGFFEFLVCVGETIGMRARRPGLAMRTAPDDSVVRVADLAEVERRLSNDAGTLTLSLRIDQLDCRQLEFLALGRGYRVRPVRLDAPEHTWSRPSDWRVLVTLSQLTRPPQPVTLLVKACVQDATMLVPAVEHVVRGLSGPERFEERVLALDLTEQSRFPRQYTSDGSLDGLRAGAQALLNAGVVDRVVTAPTEEAAIRELNERWFGLDSAHSHTVKGVPVTPQLHAFESVRTDAVLQVDIDALIGVRDAERPVLSDMLEVFADPRVVSVAYPICRPPDETFQQYFGFEDGGFVPEVRCCLLLRSRLGALRPLPNSDKPKGLQRGWYRAVEARQRETGTCSVRGGPSARFFIHPQNYRKAAPTTWPALIDRVEQLAIPPQQQGQPEVHGSLADWGRPSRGEDVVVVVVLRDQAPSTVCRLLLDLEAQTGPAFGLVLIDASGRRRASWIADATGWDPARLTVVDRHDRAAAPAAVLEAVRSFVRRDDAIVCLLDPDDLLLGTKVVAEIRSRMNVYQSDVLVGKELSAERLHLAGKHSHDLVSPRRDAATLMDGIRAVRRYVLDAIDLRDVRVRKPGSGAGPNTFARLSRSHAWVEDPHLLSIVVPSVELGHRPLCVDHFHVVRRRESEHAAPTAEVLSLLDARPARRPGDYSRGRKAFAPNLRRIELDITYDCNLKCQACNRSCTQAPTREQMSLAHIRQFVDESIATGRRWEFINVLGGEPTLHPNFQEIVETLLRDYVDAFSPETVVQVTSNGFGQTVQQRLGALPQHPRLVVNRESFKDTTRIPYFTPFNDAPIDDPSFAEAEYQKGCWVTSYCGIGLNHLGYFPCAVAGGIERVAALGRAVTSLAEVDEQIADALDTYCRLCGNFKHYAQSRGEFVPRSEKDVFDEPIVSISWKGLYERRG
ncbi:MAG: radical SAM protein [Sandaracinus sp.]|nr:radical SAM protein [Sandaracinus sp.]